MAPFYYIGIPNDFLYANHSKKGVYMEEKKELFDKRALLKLIVPVAIEQVLVVMVGMADMIMVAEAGEAAVSGISLVNSICILLIMVFNALGSGGSIVIAQYIGKKEQQKACKSANQVVLVCILTSLTLSVITLLLNQYILALIYGKVEKLVMQNAIIYFRISAFSFPFLALYNACAAIFRVMNNAKISMIMSFVMNMINVVLNIVFIYGVGMQVDGVAYATLIARVVASLVIVNLLRSKKNYIHIDAKFKLGWEPQLVKKILTIGIPQAIESSMFQVGKLCTQSLISGFGTAAIAANACAGTVEMISNIPMMSMGVALITVVGQCVGYGDYTQARRNALRVIKYTYIFLLVINPILFILAPTIASWFNLTALGTQYAVQIIRYYNICCLLISPLAFTIPNVLKAAGDVKYTLVISMCSMWIFRIAAAYLITYWFDLNVFGVWVAMSIDWLVRAIFNVIRFAGKKWETKAVVERDEEPVSIEAV